MAGAMTTALVPVIKIRDDYTAIDKDLSGLYLEQNCDKLDAKVITSSRKRVRIKKEKYKEKKKSRRKSVTSRAKSCPPARNEDVDNVTYKISTLNVNENGARSTLKPIDSIYKDRTNVRLPTLPMFKSLNVVSSDNPIKNRDTLAVPGLFTSPSANSIESDSSHIAPTGKKLRIKPSLLVCIKPENQETEKVKFFASKFSYNPQFTYKNTPSKSALNKHSEASDELMAIAIKIMRNALDAHGSYERFERKTGGGQMTRAQIEDTVMEYLRQEELEDEIQVMISTDLISRACMTRVKGRPTLQVRVHNMRENWVNGMLYHEIGTHYYRTSNNKYQPWYNFKKRKELELRPLNPTEEGLASLHSVLFRKDPCLWRCGLLYYTIYKASLMSFADLFRDLGQFVKDVDTRWDYCMRAKRGQVDTSQPGAFCKDQVYLVGALQILKGRHSIDFHKLLQFGKVDFRDLDRLERYADTTNTRIPAFMEDIDHYRNSLDEILFKNGLTDNDLKALPF